MHTRQPTRKSYRPKLTPSWNCFNAQRPETPGFLTVTGVTYANRAQGATTGAWPGYQPFGGWKGSGSTGKAIASFYYLPLYLREQSRTVVR